MMNHAQLKAQWEAMEAAKLAIVNELDQWTESDHLSQPEGAWSASQVIEHLLSSEMGTLGYMKKKTSSGFEAIELSGQENAQASHALNSRLASGERYKAPAVLPEPAGGTSWSIQKAQWNALRNDFENFLNGLTPEFFDRLVFRQPIAGPLNLGQTLEFVAHHIAHHQPQFDRIKVSLAGA